MNTYTHLFITEEESLPFYVKAVGRYKNQLPVKRPEGYPGHQWLHCTAGQGKLLIDGKDFIISQNQGFYISPEIPHEHYAIEEPWETHWVIFSGDELKKLLSFLKFHPYDVFSFADLNVIDSMFTDIFNTAKTNNIAANYRCSGKLYSLLLEIRNNLREENSSFLKKVQPVIVFIETNFHRDITIEEMASTLQVSVTYLCRIFKKTMGMRPFAYLTLHRIQRAKELLITDTSISVEKIASLVGYHDESYFCAIFKKHEGITPAVFRNINKVY